MWRCTSPSSSSPAVPLRQWVVAVPRALRFPLARDRPLRRAVISIVVRSIFMGVPLGVAVGGAQVGAQLWVGLDGGARGNQ